MQEKGQRSLRMPIGHVKHAASVVRFSTNFVRIMAVGSFFCGAFSYPCMETLSYWQYRRLCDSVKNWPLIDYQTPVGKSMLAIICNTCTVLHSADSLLVVPCMIVSPILLALYDGTTCFCLAFLLCILSLCHIYFECPKKELVTLWWPLMWHY